MKRLILGLLAVLLLCTPVFAHPPITVYVDGAKVNFDQQPIIQNDRTLVPMRRIFEALDAEVFWDEPTQSVTAVSGNDVILFQIGRTALFKNGKQTYTMPVPAQIVNDRTLVPLRAVAESFGCDVAWDGIGYVVDITSAGNAPAQRPEEPDYSEQDTPMSGGYTSKATAPDGTVVLNIELRCDEVTTGSGRAAINGDMANETYGQGQAFLQAYQQKALADYQADPDDFQPYYYMGSYTLMREQDGYASFLAAVSFHDGEDESVQYFSH
ncbi:MAG: copper amine oxidase N-terminal domain-containing protein, partial [Anaerotignum sp.]|nr:copper amine oxidase N-terminal domain-containing protein [Anaerotignum sp.]